MSPLIKFRMFSLCSSIATALVIWTT